MGQDGITATQTDIGGDKLPEFESEVIASHMTLGKSCDYLSLSILICRKDRIIVSRS